MTNRSYGYMRRRTSRRRRNPRSNRLSRNEENDNDDHNDRSNSPSQERLIFDTSTTIPRPVTKNTNTVVFDLHGIDLVIPIVFLLLEDQFGDDEITSITNLQSVHYCQSSCLVCEVTFASTATTQKAIQQGLKVGDIRIRAVPVVNTIHYKDIFNYQENNILPSSQQQQQDSNDTDVFSPSMITWPKRISETNTKCTVFTLFNIPTNDLPTIVQEIKRSIIYMAHWSTIKREHPSMITYEHTSMSDPDHPSSHHGFVGPVSMDPSDESLLVGVFPVQYPGTHLKKKAYYVVIHGHHTHYSVFQNNPVHPTSSTATSTVPPMYPGKGAARLICLGNQSFPYDRIQFHRTFCFHCKQPDCHFTEDCPLDDLIDNFRSLCIHQLSN